MKTINSELIDRLTAIASEFPEEARQQLFDLIANWKNETRSAPRITITKPLSLSSRHGEVHYGETSDISVSGIYIETPARFELGEILELIISFFSEPEPVHLGGEVVRMTEDGIAVSFDKQSSKLVAKLESTISRHALIMRQPS